jgi:GNAT superfamily N-acetyltransferase
MELRAAYVAERDEVLDLLALWYGDRGFFARYNLNDPRFRDELCLVARDGGRLVATAQIFDRRIRLNGRAVAAGALGSVFTHPDYRGRGVGSALISLALATMEREGFEVSLLFSDRLDFYGRFGWRSVPRVISIVSPSPYPAPSSTATFRRFEREQDLAEVSQIFDRYSGRFNTSIVRDLSYWLGNLVYAGNPDEFFVVAARDPSPNAPITAYARVIRYYRLPAVMEYGYAPGCQQDMAALLAELLALTSGARQTGTLALYPEAALLKPTNCADRTAGLLTQTAHDPGLEKLLGELGFSLDYYTDVNYMWRVVNQTRLAARLGWEESEATERLFRLISSKDALFWTADRF